MLGAGDEVRERVALPPKAPVLVPVASEFAAAAHMGDGEHEASLEEADDGRGEARFDGDLVGAVAVQDARRAAVEREITRTDERDRHLCPVRRRRPQPLRLVSRRVVPAAHRLLLEELPLARLEVVLDR